MYDAASTTVGGAHIQIRAKSTRSRACRQHRIAPHPASAAYTGNANVPAALLNRAKGAHHAGRLIQPIAPIAAACAADPITAGASGASKAAPAASAARFPSARRALVAAELAPPCACSK